MRALDGGAIEVNAPKPGEKPVELMARLLGLLEVEPAIFARVVINERRAPW